MLLPLHQPGYTNFPEFLSRLDILFNNHKPEATQNPDYILKFKSGDCLSLL